MKKIDKIGIILFILYFSCLFSGVSTASYTPPPDDAREERHGSSGTRGCSAELGDIESVARNIAPIESSLERPVLIYRVHGRDDPPDFLITIADESETTVFERKIRLDSPASRVITIEIDRPLIVGTRYTVTAGLLCGGDEQRARIVTSTLIRVARPAPTNFDRAIGRFLEKDFSGDN